MSIVYHVEKDSVRVWLLDSEGKKTMSAQFPRKDVEYITKRIMTELDVPVETAFDLAIYVVFLKVTWGL